MAEPAHKLELNTAARLPQKLKDWHKHFEASYFHFMASLLDEKPDIERAEAAMMKWRVYRKIFMVQLLEFANRPGQITAMDEEAKWLATAIEAREKLFSAFPGRADSLLKIISVPVVYLPFIKVLEDPFADVLGQTFKFGRERSFTMVRTGTSRELDTTTHEYMHTAVRGLPAFFEEGFCRHAMQARGMEKSDLDSIEGMSRDELIVNFAGIQYPALMVAMLSEGFGEKAVEGAFFGGDVGELERRLAFSGLSFERMNKPYVSNVSTEAAAVALKIGKLLEAHISGNLKAALSRISGLAAPAPASKIFTNPEKIPKTEPANGEILQNLRKNSGY